MKRKVAAKFSLIENKKYTEYVRVCVFLIFYIPIILFCQVFNDISSDGKVKNSTF